MIQWVRQLRLNVIDYGILGFLGLVVLGVAVVQGGFHTTSSQVVQGESDIEYTVYLRNVKTLTPAAHLKHGGTVSVVIRNRPRGEVEILDAQAKPKQALVAKQDGNYVLIPDPDDKFGYDYLIRLKDHATETADGFVANGIKIKTGMHIVIEGFDFQFSGLIANVKRYVEPTANTKSEQTKKPSLNQSAGESPQLTQSSQSQKSAQ